MNELVLWPNFGAEEREPDTVPPHPRLEPLAAAWSFLFAGDPVVENVLARAPEWLRTDKPAYDFLEGARGFWPWLSTDHTVSVAEQRGLLYEAPSPDVVRRVSDKAWALAAARELELEPIPLRGLARALQPDELEPALIERVLAEWPASAAAAWTLKPRFGSSGRGRVKGRGRALDEPARNALPRLAARGGAVLEPWCDRDRDLSAQLLLDDHGVVVLGILRQHLTASGVYLGNSGRVGADGVCRDVDEQDVGLYDRAERAAKHAHGEGLRGPIGVDAFTFDTPGAAATWLRPLVEVNARFTTGHVALGVAHRARQARLVEPPFSWTFTLRDEPMAAPGATRHEVVPGAAWLWLTQE